jgi:hypothetical protein
MSANGTTHFEDCHGIQRAPHKKVSQFLMPLKSAYNKNLCLNYKNVFLKTAER